ncbi:hypothetical protein GCM10023353_20860 [Tomitella cavernea]|uniref:Uncharacterized protein n=2 Tax=Tomitella cavernea TaxID=1387982 RepID=A0ABP9CQJ3_9ACTN
MLTSMPGFTPRVVAAERSARCPLFVDGGAFDRVGALDAVTGAWGVDTGVFDVGAGAFGVEPTGVDVGCTVVAGADEVVLGFVVVGELLEVRDAVGVVVEALLSSAEATGASDNEATSNARTVKINPSVVHRDTTPSPLRLRERRSNTKTPFGQDSESDPPCRQQPGRTTDHKKKCFEQ